ncbi:MAG: hypothetical protein IJP66_05020, partial [Kiritimatiellae bacterium]|nr:hypothetical protein [Kiritimatiellia bacterium]
MANASQKTDPPSILVGLLMAGNFGAEVSEGIQEELEVRRLAWNMCYVRTPETFTTTARWMLRAGTLAGAITYYCSPLRTNPLRRARVPLVCLNADREGYASRPGARRRTAYVEMDFEAIARAALDH